MYNREFITKVCMSSSTQRLAKGYIFANKKVYFELWATSDMCGHYQLRIFYKKLSYAWVSGHEEWRDTGTYLYTWFDAPEDRDTYSRWMSHVIQQVIIRTQLVFFEESRMWLTKKEREISHMLAVDSIGILDAEQLLNCDVCDMPRVFHEEVSNFRKEYEDYLNRKEREDREMASKLNTREGLAYLLKLAKMHGEHQPAVTFISQVVFDLTELWDK